MANLNMKGSTFFDTHSSHSQLPSTRVQADELAFLTLCDLALNTPFLGGKIIELGKFCFIKAKFEPNLSCFSK